VFVATIADEDEISVDEDQGVVTYKFGHRGLSRPERTAGHVNAGAPLGDGGAAEEFELGAAFDGSRAGKNGEVGQEARRRIEGARIRERAACGNVRRVDTGEVDGRPLTGKGLRDVFFLDLEAADADLSALRQQDKLLVETHRAL